MPTGANNKKKYTYIWVSAIILIFGIFAVYEITKRVKGGTVVENDRMSVPLKNTKVGFVVNQGEKRRVPDFSFYNQDSVLITNEDYLGKVYVVEFFFTTCPTICPVMTKNLVELQETFKGDEDFGVASFTINPRYDTPSVLTKYAKKYGITDEDWHLMTGNQDKIYQLAQEGFYIFANEDQDAPGGFEHSGMFALVDKKGYIRSRKDEFGNPLIYYRGTITEEQGVNSDGETQQITILKEDIKKLLAE
ncbi:electron transport protein SCO1/SenC [Allomuricauda ruestringensis DSM 13258]|uniref:Electron transport protein SCO1/SenC n=1 Tax=Allomuricauda ruestringensis (strain DSM 13258 / CIP 107369 / LMG 19739 / B1) TaxID=886377 RepID=G2PJW2_ALLRU|nr:SCO family protein [Allomuricauda ruestringensis]AEM70917.1 electron transport protein SCO1/SenC [Allomuricauda ruestringensis DSM 13258]